MLHYAVHWWLIGVLGW